MGLRKTRKNRSKKIGGGLPNFFGFSNKSEETQEEKDQRQKEEKEVIDYIESFINEEKYADLFNLYWKCKFRIFILKSAMDEKQATIETNILKEIKNFIYDKLKLNYKWILTGKAGVINNTGSTYVAVGSNPDTNNIYRANKYIKNLTTTVYSETIPNKKKDELGNVVKVNRLLMYLISLENPQFKVSDSITIYNFLKSNINEYYVSGTSEKNKYDNFKAKEVPFNSNVNADRLFNLPYPENGKYKRFEKENELPTNGGSKRKKSGTKKKRRKTKRI